MAGMSTSALLDPNVRPSASAEVDLLVDEQQRGCSLGGLPNQVELSPGGAAGLKASEPPTEFLLGTHRLGFSQSLTDAASESRLHRLTGRPAVLSHPLPDLRAQTMKIIPVKIKD